MTSALFRHIEQLHGQEPWGDFLDAGTGVNSALWARTLKTRTWTAVSGSARHLATVRTRLGCTEGNERLLLGNWIDTELLAGESYDTVLADYLVGAIDGFAPYFQSSLFERLRPLTRRRLYVVGLDPYVTGAVATESERMVRAIGRVRDATLLLADQMPYREYPLEWTLRALQNAGFEVTDSKRFANRYRERWIHAQLEIGVQRLPKIANHALASGLQSEIERLRTAAVELCAREDGLRAGHDYVVAARVR